MAVLGRLMHALPVTPSDSVSFPSATTAISVAVGGTVTVDTYGGERNVTLTLPAGLFDLSVTKIYSTGTAATGLTRYWS